jgi:hypothetical protein
MRVVDQEEGRCHRGKSVQILCATRQDFATLVKNICVVKHKKNNLFSNLFI